jgi:hydroxymethylpyrimidine pyrophosphatase-like HAD family hydrolase
VNSIYYRLSFTDLIKKFNETGNHFFFLTNYYETLGFVSYVHLNSQLVYDYLYQIIADLEQTISSLLKKHIEQNEVIEVFRESDDSEINKIVKEFEKSANIGYDNSIFEYMYFQSIGFALGKFHIKLPKEFHKLNKFTKKFAANGTYNSLRNNVMHPVRPLIEDFESIKLIDELLTDYQEMKEILR